MLGREHHVGGAEQRVGTRGEHLDRDVVVALDREPDRRTRGAPDPVALHLLDGIGPVERGEIVEQAVGVRGDAQHPLLQRPAIHGEVPALAATVAGHLLVREDGTETRAPVDRRVRLVGEAVGVDEAALLERTEIVERDVVGGRETARAQLLHQRGDGARPLRLLVVPGVVDLQEDPLRPAVVLHVGGRRPAPRVVAEAERTQLPLHRGDVLFGGGTRMRARLDRVLLGRQAERVVAHRVQDVEAVHALEAGVHIGRDVTERVADMQPDPARVREHVEDEQAGAPGEAAGIVAQQTRAVRRGEDTLGVPAVLPLALDLVGERGGVSLGRGFVGHIRPRLPAGCGKTG